MTVIHIEHIGSELKQVDVHQGEADQVIKSF
jgi:hypothetical protein